jgi:CheY-like chemotaxis protein
VLVVEDAAELRMLLQLVLSAEGFVVSEAADGPAGVLAATADPPDVVLLDVQLPLLDGPEVLRALRAAPRTAEVPVVFLTGEPPGGDALLLSLGARAVLRKPFRPGSVAHELAALL